jgi:hypothetical protein
MLITVTVYCRLQSPRNWKPTMRLEPSGMQIMHWQATLFDSESGMPGQEVTVTTRNLGLPTIHESSYTAPAPRPL